MGGGGGLFETRVVSAPPRRFLHPLQRRVFTTGERFTEAKVLVQNREHDCSDNEHLHRNITLQASTSFHRHCFSLRHYVVHH